MIILLAQAVRVVRRLPRVAVSKLVEVVLDFIGEHIRLLLQSKNIVIGWILFDELIQPLDTMIKLGIVFQVLNDFLHLHLDVQLALLWLLLIARVDLLVLISLLT